MHAASLSHAEEWAAWRLSKKENLGRVVKIFETREIEVGTGITADSICGFCHHKAKLHLGDNNGKTKCTGSESCVCRRFRMGGGVPLPTAIPA
jgi:hypothetical protein